MSLLVIGSRGSRLRFSNGAHQGRSSNESDSGGRRIAAVGGGVIPGCLCSRSRSAGGCSPAWRKPRRHRTTPSITGIVQAGQTLTANPGTWTPIRSRSLTYHWYSAWTAAASWSATTRTTYPVTAADEGKTISVTVTADGLHRKRRGGDPCQRRSCRPRRQNTVAPAITGIAQVGQTLTANPGTWTGTAPITYPYAWTGGGAGGHSDLDLHGGRKRTSARQSPSRSPRAAPAAAAAPSPQRRRAVLPLPPPPALLNRPSRDRRSRARR